MLKGTKKKLLMIGVVLIIIVFVGVGVAKANKGQKADGKQVETVTIQKQDIESHIQTTGQIESMDKREVVSDVEEKIEKVFVQKGDKVEKDQILMKLEETNIRYKIKEAETRLAIEQIQ